MRVLILGGSGMLGHRLWLACRDRYETFVTLRGRLEGQPWTALFDPERTIEGVDLLEDDRLAAALLRSRADVVINAVGLVKQRTAEKDLLANMWLNALLPHRVADLCAAAGARLIHISTDSVFSGRGGGYTEADLPDPPDLYGRAKLLGEVEGPGQLTLRTSFIGRELSHRYGLLEWLLSHRGGEVRGYTGAIFSGLTTAELAQTIVAVVERFPTLSGVRHVASAPIAKSELLAGINAALDLGITLAGDDSMAINRSLDDSRFRAETALPRPSWSKMIEQLATDPIPYDIWRGPDLDRAPAAVTRKTSLACTR